MIQEEALVQQRRRAVLRLSVRARVAVRGIGSGEELHTSGPLPTVGVLPGKGADWVKCLREELRAMVCNPSSLPEGIF